MNAWSIHQGDIKLYHLEALKDADALFMELTETTDCHKAVDEFHRRYPDVGRPARGWWRNPAYKHSWIEFPGDDVILDIYPIGQMRPLLIVVGYGTMRSLYTEAEDLTECRCRSYFDCTGQHVEDCPLFKEPT